MQLKAKRNKGYYKNTDAWLDAVYRNNKAKIDEAMADVRGMSARVAFKEHVKAYMEEGLTARKAVNALSRSTVFTSTAERLRNNMYSALKQDTDAYKAFRNLTRENGRYTEIDFNEFKWDKDQHMYIYKGQVGINFKNSPQEIIVTML